MEPISCTHDKFDFTRTKKPLKRIIRIKQKTKRKTTIPESQVESMSTQDIDVSNLPSVLGEYTIYIHHSTNRFSLRVIAEGLGAAVVTEMTGATTHLVIEPKGDPKAMKVVKQALANGIICSSPQWLMECYEKKMYFSAVHFPYAMQKDTHVLGSNPAEMTPVSNPFDNEYIDFDAEESRKANGGQTNLDQFITRGRQQDSDGVVGEDGAAAGGISTPLDSYQQFDGEISMPSTSQTCNTQGGILEEDEEMRREFYYNSNDRSVASRPSSVETTVQETEEEKRQAEEKALQAQQAIQQRLSTMEREPQRSKKTLQSGFGERLRIWYGEHAIRSEEARKRKAVQSVLGGSSGSTPAGQQQQQQQQQQQRLRPSSVAATVSHASTSASTSTTRRQPAASTRRRQPVQHHQLKRPRV
ncbi:Hydroxyacid-oxoacid transhydrogenase [Mucor velutinosus]|uniref:Hydroxyacid-oxoacid transhydrogenase n=1 Tax=Mucor velutinosus TaxID=708070 RepID=A0AAN7DED2_9FUNG|nr:Hydroxyacid-oxoacid transhydrogenase [Mucor velutinosus]